MILDDCKSVSSEGMENIIYESAKHNLSRTLGMVKAGAE